MIPLTLQPGGTAQSMEHRLWGRLCDPHSPFSVQVYRIVHGAQALGGVCAGVFI